MRRLLDVFFSLFILIVLSPLLLPVMLLLWLTGEHEIFFLQSRVGRHGKHFMLYKFATMLKNSPNMGTGTVTLRRDPRILPMGHFLRKTKLNEIPQLLNVLFGDMSLIGPRPQTQRCFDAFPRRSQDAIVQVLPGLSGIGSIVFRDEEDMMSGHADPHHFYDHVIMPYKGELEEWYVHHQGVGVYLLLIFLTAWVIVWPRSRLMWRLLPLPKRPAGLQRFIS